MKNIKHILLLGLIILPLCIISLKAQTDDFSISGNSRNSIPGGCAFDGTNYLVGITGDAISDSNVTLQFISPTGQLLGSRISVGESGSAPLVAFDGTNYLIIWGDRYVRFLDNGEDAGMTNIYGRFISPSGNFVGDKFTIVNDAYIKGCVSGKVHYNGDHFFFIYRENNTQDDYGPVYGQRISSGAALIGSPIQISDNNAGDIDLAFDGSNYLVIFWTDATDIYGQFVSSTGTLIGSNFVIDNTSNNSDNPISITYGDSTFLVAFHDQAANHSWNLKARFVSTSGNVDAKTITIADSSQGPFLPLLAYDGTNFLVTWIHMDAKQIRGQFYTPSGLPYESEYIIFDSTEGVLPIGGVASFSGNKYLSICTKVAWDSQKATKEDNYGIYGKFVDHSTGLVENVNNQLNTTLFPNPAKDMITVCTDNIDVVLSIYDVNGRLVKTVARTSHEHNISIHDLSNGIYFIKINANSSTHVQKLIIQR